MHDRASSAISVGNAANMAVTHSYELTIKTDDGRELHWPISSGLYESIQIGARLAKEPGTELPNVIEKVKPQPSDKEGMPSPSQDITNGWTQPSPPVPPSTTL